MDMATHAVRSAGDNPEEPVAKRTRTQVSSAASRPQGSSAASRHPPASAAASRPQQQDEQMDLDHLSLDELSLDILERAESEGLERKANDGWLNEMSRCKPDHYLEAVGFECAERRQVQRDLMRLGQAVHVAEVFSPPRMTAQAHRFGLTPGMAFDLNIGFDLDDPKDVRRLWRYLVEERPLLIFGSPECRAFCRLQNLNKGSAKYAATLAQGIRHMKLVMQIYEWQMSQGRLFCHEQPWGNWSWDLACVKRVLAAPGVYYARCDQCAFGQWTWKSPGEWAYAQKSTGFMSNCPEILENLSVRCPGNHEHQQLIGGRALECAAYPPRLVAAVLRGLRKHLTRIGILEEMHAGPTVEEPCPAAAVEYDKT